MMFSNSFRIVYLKHVVENSDIRAEDIGVLEEIDLPSASFLKIEGNAIWVRYKSVDEEFGIEQAKAHSKAISSLNGSLPKHLIIDFRGADVSFSNEAREYFAKAQEHSELRKSQALVVDSLAQKLVANFYMKFNKPECPVRIFTNARDAWKWVSDLEKSRKSL